MKNQRRMIAPLCFVALAMFFNGSVQAAPSGNDGPVATAQVSASEIKWQPKVEYSAIVLTVSTPDGDVLRVEFAAGTVPSFRSTDDKGLKRPDGQYIYEMRVVPVIAPGTREALAASREKGNSDEMMREMKSHGMVPKEEAVQSGAFRIMKGAIVMGGATEGESSPTPPKKTITLNEVRPQSSPFGYRLTPVSMASRNLVRMGPSFRPFDQVIADDLIVQMSICVGLDCVNNENFGFDTIRLKENNLRIGFDDTSTGTFPANDWELTANDSASGGLNRFSITDITNSRTPFTVEANAPSNSVYVDDIGRLGLGTATPVLDIQKTSGNTPALRLEQTGASGFSAQTWDVAGNEANFFIRDVTGGSRLSFRIEPGAPTNSIIIKGDGKVGMGTFSPEQRLHVFGNMVVEGSIDVRDNNFGMNMSQPFDTRSVLERLAKVSLFKSSGSDNSAVSHLTMNVKELNAAFGLGEKDRISLMDFNTISLAAIKAAYAKLQEKDAEITSLQKQNAELQVQLGELQRRMEAIEAYLASQQRKQ